MTPTNSNSPTHENMASEAENKTDPTTPGNNAHRDTKRVTVTHYSQQELAEWIDDTIGTLKFFAGIGTPVQEVIDYLIDENIPYDVGDDDVCSFDAGTFHGTVKNVPEVAYKKRLEIEVVFDFDWDSDEDQVDLPPLKVRNINFRIFDETFFVYWEDAPHKSWNPDDLYWSKVDPNVVRK